MVASCPDKNWTVIKVISGDGMADGGWVAKTALMGE